MPHSRPNLDENQSDVGIATLRSIHSQLMIDEQWTRWAERSFSWIGHRLTQTVQAAPLFVSLGVPVSDVAFTTRLVAEVAASGDELRTIITEWNSRAVGSALVYLPELKELVLTSAFAIHDEIAESRSVVLATYAILQLCEAESIVESLVQLTRGRIASDSGVMGVRPQPDGMLRVAEDVFIPRGSGPSEFRSLSELRTVADYYAGSRFATFGASPEGVCIEVPFGEAGTSLVRLSPNLTHPWLRSGLTVDTFLPGVDDRDKMMILASALQLQQLQTVEGGDRLGAWTLKETNGNVNIAWTRFVPNALFQPGVLLDVAFGEVGRAIWVDKLLYPNLPARNAWDVIEARAKSGGYIGFGQLPPIPS